MQLFLPSDKKSYDALLTSYQDENYIIAAQGIKAVKESDFYVVCLSKKISSTERLLTAIYLSVITFFSAGIALISPDTRRDWERVFRGKSIVQIQCQLSHFPLNPSVNENKEFSPVSQPVPSEEVTPSSPKPVVSSRSFQRPQFSKTMRKPDEKSIVNGRVYDKECYLLRDKESASFEESYIHLTTFGPISKEMIEKTSIPLASNIPSLSINDADIKGHVTLKTDGYVIGSELLAPELQFLNNNFDRADGINWRDYPGEILVGVTSNLFLKEYFSLLPAQLFEGKQPGDTVIFWWQDSLVALIVSPIHDLDRTLQAAKLNAYRSNKGEPYAPRVVSSSVVSHEGSPLVTVEPFLSYPAPEEVFNQAGPISERDKNLYAQPTSDGTSPPALHQPQTPLFTVGERGNERLFVLTLCGGEIRYFIYPEHIAIVGLKERSRNGAGTIIDQSPGFFDDNLFILDFRGANRKCSLEMLQDLAYDNGSLSFKCCLT